MISNKLLLGESGEEIELDPIGRLFSEKLIEFGRKDRMADASLKKDIMAIKREFTLAYDQISGNLLEYFKYLYDLKETLSLIVYRSSTLYDTYSVSIEPFEWERLLLVEDGVYSGVTITLEEV